MPTPTHYKRLAKYLQSKQLPLWASLPAGLLLGIVGIYVYQSAPAGALRVSSVVVGWLGGELALISWALIGIELWFQEREPLPFTKRLGEKYPGLSGAWYFYLCLILDFWFICCILVSIPILRILF